jgi:phage major head subunit gpT-like protein
LQIERKKMINSDYVIKTFFNALDSYKGEDWIAKVSAYFPDADPIETLEWIGAVPPLRKWIGARTPKQLKDNVFSITNVKYENSIDMPVAWLTGDKSGQVDLRIAELAEKAQAHWAYLMSQLVVDGETGLCYDGSFFFAADHNEGDSGDQINLLTATQVPALGVVAPTQPTAPEAIAAILGCIAYMKGYVDDQNEPLQPSAKHFIVQAGMGLWPYLVHAVLGDIVAGNVSNVLKELSKQGFVVECVGNPYLDAWTDTFVLLRGDGISKPFVRLEQEPITIGIKDETSEYAFDTDCVQAGVKAVRACGYGMWPQAAKCTLS